MAIWSLYLYSSCYVYSLLLPCTNICEAQIIPGTIDYANIYMKYILATRSKQAGYVYNSDTSWLHVLAICPAQGNTGSVHVLCISWVSAIDG